MTKETRSGATDLGPTPASLLGSAKNAAGDRAVAAAETGDYGKSREWQAVAMEIARVWDMALAAAAPTGWVRRGR